MNAKVANKVIEKTNYQNITNCYIKLYFIKIPPVFQAV